MLQQLIIIAIIGEKSLQLQEKEEQGKAFEGMQRHRDRECTQVRFPRNPRARVYNVERHITDDDETTAACDHSLFSTRRRF